MRKCVAGGVKFVWPVIRGFSEIRGENRTSVSIIKIQYSSASEKERLRHTVSKGLLRTSDWKKSENDISYYAE
jgi:hypothetical protein